MAHRQAASLAETIRTPFMLYGLVASFASAILIRLVVEPAAVFPALNIRINRQHRIYQYAYTDCQYEKDQYVYVFLESGGDPGDCRNTCGECEETKTGVSNGIFFEDAEYKKPDKRQKPKA
jgi:hypothetical protein